MTITHHFVGQSTASASSGGCLYQADSRDVYSTVISTSDMAEMKTCSRERASSAALNHEVHQRTFLSSPSHKKHTNNSGDQSNVLKTSVGYKARFTHLEGTKMGQRFSIYLFIQAEFSFINTTLLLL